MLREPKLKFLDETIIFTVFTKEFVKIVYFIFGNEDQLRNIFKICSKILLDVVHTLSFGIEKKLKVTSESREENLIIIRVN